MIKERVIEKIQYLFSLSQII